VLELTAADELVALENMGVLQQNGFEVALEEDQPAGRRLKLIAQPVNKNTEFDVQGKILYAQYRYTGLTCGGGHGNVDLEEILHLLRDRPFGTLVRSTKTRAMFAMRACRKSTMVGDPLNAKQMTTVSLNPPPFFTRHSPCFFLFLSCSCLTDGSSGQIIRHMGTIEQPWNCPHGRPTMRHLSDLGAQERREGGGPVNWAMFVPH
jgi:DNA mismatch repair protein PMS2